MKLVIISFVSLIPMSHMMASEDPKPIDTPSRHLQSLHDYHAVESPWIDKHHDMEASLMRLMEAEAEIWQLCKSLPEGDENYSTASRVSTLLHEEFLCVATRAVEVFARHQNPRLLKLVIAHLEAYPYDWCSEGWENLLPNLKKAQKPHKDQSKVKDTEQDGAGQPATTPESKLEGEDKPKPESEERSR